MAVGCKGVNGDDALKEFKSLVTESETYNLKGTMDIVSNEKEYTYNVDVSYKKGDYYKVNLLNTTNNHEQVILKNSEGVYVISPNMNKSFKFQSDWPNNSSQAYILETILNDLESDTERGFEEAENEKYVLTSKVNYPNNSNLTHQKVTLNKKMEPEKVEILDDKETAGITMTITSIEWKKKFDKEYFELSSSIKEDITESEKTTSEIEDVIYPMYLPSGTTFESQEVIKTDESDRVILTFTGEKPFILVEEASGYADELEITSATGDLVFYETILGALSDTSVSWTKDGVEYYIIGQNLTEQELLQIASSTTTVALVK